MEGMLGWFLLVPALYLMITGRLFSPRGIFEIPSDSFVTRCSGFVFMVAAFLMQLDLVLGFWGIVVALVVLAVSIVMGIREMLKRKPGTWLG